MLDLRQKVGSLAAMLALDLVVFAVAGWTVFVLALAASGLLAYAVVTRL